MKPSMAVVGNLTIDEIARGRSVDRLPGGSALFTSAAAAFLSTKVSLVSSIGKDYPATVLRWLRARGVDVRRVSRTKKASTKFRIEYERNERRLTVLTRGQRLVDHAVSGKWDAVHLGPVFQEVSPSAVSIARRSCRVLSLDLQGFVRDSGRIGRVRLVSRRLGPIIRQCDLVKASVEESRALTSIRDPVEASRRILKMGPMSVSVTMGAKGTVLALANTGMFLVPAYPEKHLEDPTGAGDVFSGGYLSVLISTKEHLRAAALGSAFASLTSRRRGLAKFDLSSRELFRRAGTIHDRVRTLSSG